MVKIAMQDGTCTHTGSACSPPVAGTLTPGTNSFVRVGAQYVMVDDGTMEVPAHLPPSCIPPTETHSYTPNVFGQSFVKVETHKICLVGDNYNVDATAIDFQGSNTFVDIV